MRPPKGNGRPKLLRPEQCVVRAREQLLCAGFELVGRSQSYASVYLAEGGRAETLRLSNHPPGRHDRPGVRAFLTFVADTALPDVDRAVRAAIAQYRDQPAPDVRDG